MIFSTNTVLYIFIITIVFIFLFIFLLIKSIKNKKMLQALKVDLQKYKNDDYDIENTEASKDSNQENLTLAQKKKNKYLESEIQRLKRVIEDTKGIAQNASMAKTDFLTNIKHEIRTPMNSILVFSEILKNNIQTEELKTYASNILESGHNLLHLLDRILDLSSLESGTLKVSTKAVDIESFFSQEVERHRDEAKKKGLELALEIDSDIPISLMLDAQKLARILDNLLSNALKYTSYGAVKVLVQQRSFNSTKHESNIQIVISDTGVGIVKENHEKIFNIFESKDYNGVTQYQGTGLGLSISRKLARLMQGDIKVKSENSKGSEFSLFLNNVEVVLGSTSQKIKESDIDFSLIKKSKILVIDEMQETLDSFSKFFDTTDVEVITYGSTRDAIGYLHTNKIDLLCINVNTLTMDEGAVSKVLSKLTLAPVVGLVESNLRNIHFHKSGVQPVGHIEKPIGSVELFRVLLKVLNPQEFTKRVNRTRTIKNIGLSFESDTQASLNYFREQSSEINKLLLESLNTNDLNRIKKFAFLVKEEAQKHTLKNVEDFSLRLLNNVENFDIQGIARMLEEYKMKSERFKKV